MLILWYSPSWSSQSSDWTVFRAMSKTVSQINKNLLKITFFNLTQLIQPQSIVLDCLILYMLPHSVHFFINLRFSRCFAYLTLPLYTFVIFYTGVQYHHLGQMEFSSKPHSFILRHFSLALRHKMEPQEKWFRNIQSHSQRKHKWGNGGKTKVCITVNTSI